MNKLKNTYTPVKVKVYTDGSCYYKVKLGGIGVYMVYTDSRGKEREDAISEGFEKASIGKMELLAVLVAMKKIKDKDIKVRIYSDSQYVVNTFEKGWIFSWEEYSFVGKKNSEILKLMIDEYRKFSDIKLKWVRGHSGVYGNEIADGLADYKGFDEYKSIPNYLKSL